MDTYELTSPERKLVMWCKCKELFGKGLSIRQISRELGIDRKTVRCYLHMSREEFDASDVYQRHYKRILDPYESYVKTCLEAHPELSSGQIYDWLRKIPRSAKSEYQDGVQLHSTYPGKIWNKQARPYYSSVNTRSLRRLLMVSMLRWTSEKRG